MLRAPGDLPLPPERDGTCVLNLTGGGWLGVDAMERTITFATPAPLTDEGIVHPGLSPAVAFIAWLAGQPTMHACAVIHEGGAWALLANRGGGKSTTGALLVRRGLELLTDDLLVIDGGVALAGPASIDLRQGPGERLGATPLGRVGSRERWRSPVPVKTLSAPLRGFVVLDWLAEGPPVVETLPAADRLAQIAAHRSFTCSPDQLLDLMALPVLSFRRPQDLDAADASLDVLLEALDAHADPVAAA